eukprot:TRINITY_DN2350_c0_g1_i7.p1 TRINITY_DN2350_c0_g1~~TRINITY_DN2350_c0_g1_i7.p1  ORF type:complete len:100 (+),score=4.91 TRINITY_DN2350_c0_g1_i7:937-1236(+)
MAVISDMIRANVVSVWYDGVPSTTISRLHGSAPVHMCHAWPSFCCVKADTLRHSKDISLEFLHSGAGSQAPDLESAVDGVSREGVSWDRASLLAQRAAA